MATDQPAKEEHNREKTVRDFWWKYKTTEDQRDGIIKSAFNTAHPTNEAIRKTADECKERIGK